MSASPLHVSLSNEMGMSPSTYTFLEDVALNVAFMSTCPTLHIPAKRTHPHCRLYEHVSIPSLYGREPVRYAYIIAATFTYKAFMVRDKQLSFYPDRFSIVVVYARL